MPAAMVPEPSVVQNLLLLPYRWMRPMPVSILVNYKGWPGWVSWFKYRTTA